MKASLVNLTLLVAALTLLKSGATVEQNEIEAKLKDFANNMEVLMKDIISNEIKDLSTKQKQSENTIHSIIRQMMQDELSSQQTRQTGGHSGITGIRSKHKGSKNYHTPSFSSNSVNSIHDHNNNIRTVGMGEVNVVMNGIEFRTRHNDYKLNKPATAPSANSSIDKYATTSITFPDVPPEVNGTVEEQIVEMREWFKAFRDHDYSVRDYRKYFKPILCYMEGAWTSTVSNTLNELSDSDRHFIDAKTWDDLQNKIRFMLYTGRKNTDENYAVLPTSFFYNEKDGATVAQWNYRILCHPLKDYLPIDKLSLVDDLKSRAAYSRDITEHAKSRAARFKITEKEGIYNYGLQDKLMYEVPGMNGYNSFMAHSGIGDEVTDYFGNELNAAYYHRVYKIKRRDAMGSQVQSKTFGDDGLYFAETTQPSISPMEMETCKWRRCTEYKEKWTYAIPLEIIYLTPLHGWNPYNIKIDTKHNKAKSGSEGRKPENALEQAGLRTYYITPYEFFKSAKPSGDKADTASGYLYVKDSNGTAQKTVASGVKIFTNDIEGIGSLRTRYPISPMYVEGNPISKELEALKDLVLRKNKFRYLLPEGEDNDDSTEMEVNLQPSRSPKIIQHTHSLTVTESDVAFLKENPAKSLLKTTTEVQGHTHNVYVRFFKNNLRYSHCEGDGTGRWNLCWDKHPRNIYLP